MTYRKATVAKLTGGFEKKVNFSVRKFLQPSSSESIKYCPKLSLLF